MPVAHDDQLVVHAGEHLHDHRDDRNAESRASYQGPRTSDDPADPRTASCTDALGSSNNPQVDCATQISACTKL